MRASLIFAALVSLFLAGIMRAQDKETPTTRIAALIRQLGDDDFRKREVATRALERLGDRALPALRAALASSDDAEIRLRAREIIPAITDRAANEDLKKLQGIWSLVSGEVNGKQVSGADKSVTFQIIGNQWLTRNAGTVSDQGSFRVIDYSGPVRRVDLIGVGGGTTYAIFQVEDDTLKYCRHAAVDYRPTDFTTKEGDGRNSTVWKRIQEVPRASK